MRISLFILTLCLSLNVFGQRSAETFTGIPNVNTTASALRDVTDTIVPLSFISSNQGGLGCFTGIYSSTDSGYVSGNNHYGDLEKSQFYALSQMGFANNGMLQSVLVKFAYKTMNATPENVVVNIYSVDTSQFLPFTLLGTSQAVNLSGISSSGEYTLFTFDTPVAVSDSFFVSVQLPVLAGDTLVVLSTQDNCVGNSSWAWEKWKNESWHSILNSWVLDIDLAIFPVIDLPYGNGIQPVSQDALLRVYPNPAVDEVTLQLTRQIVSTLSVRITDVQGRMLKQFTISSAEANAGLIHLPLQGLETSMYILEISDSQNSNRIPFFVTKQ